MSSCFELEVYYAHYVLLVLKPYVHNLKLGTSRSHPIMAFIYDIPLEILEQIILELDPIDMASLAQTCKAYHALLYQSPSQHLWRSMYLSQPLDDPRRCVDPLGNSLVNTEVDWKDLLQRIIRLRTLARNHSLCKSEERELVFRTLRYLICQIPPTPDVPSEELSLNLVWLAALLRGGAFLDIESWPADLPETERQLLACIHTHFGISTRDRRRSQLTLSRAFVYAMRHYTWDNEFGPFLMDGSGRVNWVHLQAIHHVMSMHLVPQTFSEEPEEGQSAFTIFPMSLPFCQTFIPQGLVLDQEKDWAGVAGVWTCAFCFCDHRELLRKLDLPFPSQEAVVDPYLLISFAVYNNFNVGISINDTPDIPLLTTSSRSLTKTLCKCRYSLIQVSSRSSVPFKSKCVFCR